jgi:chemotaxis protein methyltransferase CheR
MADKSYAIIDERLENENLEIKLFLEAIYQKYGYDFRNYAKASLKRRIKHRLSLSGLESISEMLHKALYDISFFETLLLDLSLNVSEMFRDPSFFLALRKKVLPALKKNSFIKIWHAGCATGEEVYSMAILLKEVDIYDKTQIYATDFNEVILKKAKEGIFPLDNIKLYTVNYQKAGGRKSFADYYTAKYKSAVIQKSLKKNIVFADHNLVTDRVFGEMDLIVCRNVLIYFDKDLQDHAIKLFIESLSDSGLLCLGSKESIKFSKYSGFFEDVASKEKIYRRKSTLVDK